MFVEQENKRVQLLSALLAEPGSDALPDYWWMRRRRRRWRGGGNPRADRAVRDAGRAARSGRGGEHGAAAFCASSRPLDARGDPSSALERAQEAEELLSLYVFWKRSTINCVGCVCVCVCVKEERPALPERSTTLMSGAHVIS